MLGRGVRACVTMVASSGSTWYFLASCMNSACSSFSFSGYLAARSVAWDQSSFRLYSSHGYAMGSAPTPPGDDPRRPHDPGAGHPAVVVNRTIAEHLEVL